MHKHATLLLIIQKDKIKVAYIKNTKQNAKQNSSNILVEKGKIGEGLI